MQTNNAEYAKHLRERARYLENSYGEYIACGGDRDIGEEKYIDAMNAGADALERTHWISVEERLPDESEELVLIVASGRHKNIVFDKALLLGTYYDSSGWIVEGYTEWEDACVTHWMPLPEPPEEDEHGKEEL